MKVYLRRPLFRDGKLYMPDRKGVSIPDGPLPKGAKLVEEPKPAPAAKDKKD